MNLPSYFDDFLEEIRPTGPQIDGMKDGHERLRERLESFDDLKDIIVSTFLQGSYRRLTAVRPNGEKRSDVDVIVVTNLSEKDNTPAKALDRFIPFLDEYYKGKWEPQGRSFGISLSKVDLDVVPTSAPSEVDEKAGIYKSAALLKADSLDEVGDWRLAKSWMPLSEWTGSVEARRKQVNSEPEWKTKPLRIPDRDKERWEDTHPIAQIQWTHAKNASCGSHYVNVVKVVKWWRRRALPDLKYPRGYPVEHLVGVCCPDEATDVADLFTRTLEKMTSKYAAYAALKQTPFEADHGVPSHNVLSRVSGEDFATFHKAVSAAATAARKALDEEDLTKSANQWRDLLGDKFPRPPENKSGGGNSGGGGFSKREDISQVGTTRWA